MSKLTLSLAVALAASALAASLAASPTAAAAEMPLSSQWRACDGTKLPWANAVGYAQAAAQVNATGSGTIATTVNLATAMPDTHYDVRVIQVPRPSNDCAPGAPGVVAGSLQTDAAGTGTTTFQGPIQPGATSAWVIVERPSGSSQAPTEFYTSEFAAPI